MAHSFEGEVSSLRSALLTALEDYYHVADFFAHNEPSDLETRCFYYELIVHCLSLRQLISGKVNLHSIRSLLREALNRLESLILNPFGSHTSQSNQKDVFPGLERLHRLLITLDDPHAKRAALRDCVAFGGKEKQSALLQLLLSNYTALRPQTHTEILDFELRIPRKTRDPPSDNVRTAADALSRVLKTKYGCNCDPIHKYNLQLSLETHCTKLSICYFDLYFGLEKIWQEARVHTSAALDHGSPQIPIGQDTNTNDMHRSLEHLGQRHPIHTLCKHIIKTTRRFPGYRLKLCLEKDRLWKLESEKSDFVIDKSQAPISLAHLLTEDFTMINDRIKRILSVLLAYAVLHLRETLWLSPTWGSHNVMFFKSSNGLPMRPYIETQFGDNQIVDESSPTSSQDSDEEEFDPDDLLLPPYPSLIGLAAVLMELHKAIPLQTLAEAYNISIDEESDPSDRFIIVRDVFKCCSHEFTDQTRLAIKACLDPKIGLGENGENLEAADLQTVIYNRIVHRLEDELEQGFSDVKIEHLDVLIQTLDLANGGQPVPEARKHSTTQVSSTSTLPSSLNNNYRGRKVRFQSPTPSMIPEKLEHVYLQTAQVPTMHMTEPLSKQVESASNTMVPNSVLNENTQKFVAPLVPIKTPLHRPDTLRVMNIPDDMSSSDLCEKLEENFAWKCTIHSLARASRDARWKKYATVTFPGMPNQVLAETLHKLQYQPPTNAFEYDKRFLGLTPLYNWGDSAALDIIAIEGLGTNPFGTFRAPQGDIMWLRDFLPQSFPSSRILLYGYDSKVPDSMSNQSVPEIASTCKSVVMNFRRMTKTDERPIIWLGQSMGGLIIQEVLVQASRHRSRNSSSNLLDHSIGFLGYGVPINGLRNESLLNAVRKQANFEMIRSICLEGDKPSRYLKDLAGHFAHCSERLSVHHFYETNPSPDVWHPEAVPQRMVDDQAVVGREDSYWVPRSHSELVKVPDRTDFVYTTTVQIISLVLERQLPDTY